MRYASRINGLTQLPLNARRYIDKLAELAEARVALISVGAKRGQIIKL